MEKKVRERAAFGACTVVGEFEKVTPNGRLYYRDRLGDLKWLNVRRWMVHLDPCPHCADRLVQT